MKKTLKTLFFPLVTSRTYSIRLTPNLRAQIDNGDPGLSFGYITILLASTVIEIIATFCENSPILRKFDLFWPPGTSNFTRSKNYISIFCRTYGGLSNAVYRFSLSFLVFPPPPPPAVRRWLRPPVVRGLNEWIQCRFVHKYTSSL